MSALRSKALTVACVLAGGLAAGEARVPDRSVAGATSARPAWTEVKWPFPFDAWPAGRAFRCGAAACGAQVSVYIRPKAGFCNCSVGVADDDEIDRVGDLVLLSERYRPLGEGRPIAIGSMAGRARAFRVEPVHHPARHAIGVAVSKKCDALVATVVSDRPISPLLERAAVDLLNREPIVGWAEASVGLQ
jgi:hypothetical protein